MEEEKDLQLEKSAKRTKGPYRNFPMVPRVVFGQGIFKCYITAIRRPGCRFIIPGLIGELHRVLTVCSDGENMMLPAHLGGVSNFITSRGPTGLRIFLPLVGQSVDSAGSQVFDVDLGATGPVGDKGNFFAVG